MSHHGTHDDATNGGGCADCQCPIVRLQEPGVPSETDEAAASSHELFQSYIAAGFTREEALHLTTAVTVAGIAKAP